MCKYAKVIAHTICRVQESYRILLGYIQIENIFLKLKFSIPPPPIPIKTFKLGYVRFNWEHVSPAWLGLILSRNESFISW